MTPRRPVAIFLRPVHADTDAHGVARFWLRDQPGAYWVQAFSRDGKRVSGRKTPPPTNVQRIEIPAKDPPERIQVDLRFGRGAKLQGHVDLREITESLRATTRGQGLGGDSTSLRVRLVSTARADPRLFIPGDARSLLLDRPEIEDVHAVDLDPNGAFSIHDVSPGAWTVYVVAEQLLRPTPLASGTVIVTPDDANVDLGLLH